MIFGCRPSAYRVPANPELVNTPERFPSSPGLYQLLSRETVVLQVEGGDVPAEDVVCTDKGGRFRHALKESDCIELTRER